ncbi:hypothetical protein QE375_003159 [Microbacterium foliorum]|jgi:hypothetical protein|uniref:DUF2188 domain-containing protein n=1 Tax=Microbacterium foliorum TaxID=104336 RepID=A0ABU1HU76_9MICO|nr:MULTISPECIES: DUF2188 domain-containing protein [Microbacterium]KIP90334.1 hypothetical protein RU09_11300 [Microbacterium sp. MEJ108Y]KQR48635.1 hypothetical protein ASF87_07155 [Microbacterium sp. Leaf161]MDR6143605.1 hypothetical protein [Microbacterium foliorum]
MAAGDIETFQRDGIWFNRIEGESRTLGSSFGTQDEAVRAGRGAAAARQVQHTVRTDEGPSDTGNLYDWHPRDLMN